jgi:hypothetical protein
MGGCSSSDAHFIEETYYHGDKCDPHEKIESAEDVVEHLLPVLRRWLGYCVFTIPSPGFDYRTLQTNRSRGPKASVNFIGRNEMNVDLADDRVRVCITPEGSFFLPVVGV